MYDVDFTRPTALLLGGEGAGLPADADDVGRRARQHSDERPVESLNAAVAAALLLYEARRQRVVEWRAALQGPGLDLRQRRLVEREQLRPRLLGVGLVVDRVAA